MKAINRRSQPGTAWSRFLVIIGVIAMMASYEALAAGNLPSPPTGLKAPEQPTPMPDFQLPRVNGTATFSTTEVRGKVLLMRFWSTW